MKIGDQSPWGRVQDVTEFMPGVWFVSTPSHGGFRVTGELLRQIPKKHRDYAANWSHGWGEGWFEEDCAAAAVIVAFPNFFRPEEVENAKRLIPVYFEAA